MTGISGTLTCSPGRILWATLPGAMLALLDGTLMNLALPELAHVFSRPLTEIGWVLSAYNLAFLLGILVLGLYAERLSSRQVLCWSLLALGACSLGGAFAPDLQWLIAMRVCQGVASAGITTLGYAVAVGSVPNAMRGRVLSIWASASALVIAGGPLVGGLLLTILPWYWLFLFQVPIALISLTLVSTIPAQPRVRSRESEPLRPLWRARAVYGFTSFLFCFALMGVFVLGSLALQEQTSAWLTGMLLLPISLFASVGAYCQKWMLRHQLRSQIHQNAFQALFLFAGGLWFFPWVREAPTLIFVLFGCSLGFIIGMLMATLPFLFLGQESHERLGRGSAFLTGTHYLGYSLGVVVLLYLVSLGKDGFTWAWIVSGGAAFLGFLVLAGGTIFLQHITRKYH